MKLNNKKLFEIREIKGMHIIAGLLILVTAFGILTIIKCFNGTFATEFHGQSHYKPLNDTISNKGLYGKINVALNKALKEKEYRANTLDIRGGRLQFYVPLTNDYIVDVREIRLIGFIPDSTEKDFFYNSDFKRYLEKQNENKDVAYFKIEWEKEQYPPRIKSITIDNTLGDVPLLNHSWKGQIAFEDPFAHIDPAVIYLIKDNMPIPIFTSNLPVAEIKGAHTDLITIKNAECKPNKTYEYQEWYNDFNNSNPINSKVLRVEYNENNWLEFLNRGDSIYLSNGTQDTAFIWINNRKQPIPKQINGYAFPRTFTNLAKLEIKSVNKYVYLSKTPFNVASRLANSGVTGKRIHINEDYCDLFTRQELIQLESNLDENTPNFTLTSNFVLSKVLEDDIRKYIETNLLPKAVNHKDEFQMSVCLMDISTGEIIAAPYYSNHFLDKKAVQATEIKNFNLIRHHIGSTFKPLLAFAAAAKYPSLAQFQLTNIVEKENDCCLIGYTVPHYGKDNSLFWNAAYSTSRVNFLGHSHDNYPIALTMLALTENNGILADTKVFNLLNAANLNNAQLNNLPKLIGNNDLSRIPNYYRKNQILFNDGNETAKLGESSFANLFFNLYDVEMQSRDKNDWSLSADTVTWRYLKGNTLKLYSLYPDKLNFQLDLINNFIDFENFILGQGNNYWNNVKLAEAYGRLLSKKAIKSTFLKGNNEGDSPDLFKDGTMFNHISTYNFRRTKREMENAWILFMKDWREAVAQKENTTKKGGTLHMAYNNLTEAIPNFDNNYYFYCKTGTPQDANINAHSKISKEDGVTYLSETLWRDEGVFVFGITNKNERTPKGIVGVVYIKRISTKKPTSSLEGITARDFLTPELFRKIMFYNQNRFGR